MPPTHEFDWSMPYPSQRAPVFARNCVATSQPLAAQAGLDTLRRGGNAADAAVATAAALTVIEPTSNGIGADAFALAWFGGGLHGLNASGSSPRGLRREDYDGMESVPLLGWAGVTTPGAVSGWVALHEQFGSLPFEDLLAPAVQYAREGFHVSPEIAHYWAVGAEKYIGDVCAAWRDTFLVSGRAPAVGERFRSEGHADTLERIARTKGQDFYHGELAQRIDAAARAGGGALRAEDLAAHRPEWVRPISVEYRGEPGWRLHQIPPNGQGITALIALGILRNVSAPDAGPDAVQTLHLQIEAMKLAFADARRYIADPATMDVSSDALLDDAYLATRASLIDPDRAQDFNHGAPKRGGTILLTTADAEGNMVSFIQSNYTGFGSGVVVPGTGIALHNRGCCFTLEKGHPNEIAPNKRPYHTIIPGFVTKPDGRGGETPVMAFGVMGGYMQPQGHAQVLIRMADYHQNPQAALDAPRWRIDDGLNVEVEPGFGPEVYEGLRALGHNVTVAARRGATHGRGQVIYRLEDGTGYIAGSDQRSDGCAVGF